MSIPSINPPNTPGVTFTGNVGFSDPPMSTNFVYVSTNGANMANGSIVDIPPVSSFTLPDSTSISGSFTSLDGTSNFVTENPIFTNLSDSTVYVPGSPPEQTIISMSDFTANSPFNTRYYNITMNMLDNLPVSSSTGSSRPHKNDTFETVITPLIDGESIFPMARKMIRQAKESIAIEIYNFGNPDLTGKRNLPGITDEQHFKDQAALVDELVKASNRGVKVQVLMDSSVTKSGKLQNEEVADYLKANGVQVVRYPGDAVNIDHVKLLVVDNFRAMIGGMNWGEHSPANHDANILIEGREAAELKKDIFDSSMRFSGSRPSKTILREDRENKIDVLDTRPLSHDGGSSLIKDNLLNIIYAAEKSIHAELFCLTDKEVVQALIDAHNNNIDVKILLDPNMFLINRNAFEKLDTAGVPVRWYTVNTANNEKLHGKWATFDGTDLLIGSANWTHMGLDMGVTGAKTNHEADVMVRDADATNVFEDVFNADWETRSSKDLPPHRMMS